MSPFTQPSHRASYHKSVYLLAQLCDRLGSVRVQGWTQHQIHADLYALAQQTLETLAELSPNDLSRQLRTRLHQQDF